MTSPTTPTSAGPSSLVIQVTVSTVYIFFAVIFLFFRCSGVNDFRLVDYFHQPLASFVGCNFVMTEPSGDIISCVSEVKPT